MLLPKLLPQNAFVTIAMTMKEKNHRDKKDEMGKEATPKFRIVRYRRRMEKCPVVIS